MLACHAGGPGSIPGRCKIFFQSHQTTVRMAERSKALRSGRSPLLWAWVRIPLLTKVFLKFFPSQTVFFGFFNPVEAAMSNFFLIGVDKVQYLHVVCMVAEWRSGSVLGP